MSAVQPKRLITHSEDFHTDDVFATAMLLDLFPDAEIVRTRDEKIIATGDIVYDVGKVFDPAKGRFDHHQAQAGKRENGIVYSGFGLLWREYGVQFCGGDGTVAEAIEERLVIPIDAIDNGQTLVTPKFDGVQPFTIDDIIAIMNPQPWAVSTEEPDAQFMKAVELARLVLSRLRTAIRNDLASQAYLLDLYNKAEDKRLIVADKAASVSGILNQCPGLLYVVSPRPSGSWGVLAVSTEPGSFVLRRPFPEAWRALMPAKLVEITGVADAAFCHATGFYAAAESRAGAINLAYRSLATE